jgi:hypothetical protein
VLGDEARDGPALEVEELCDRLVAPGETQLQGGDLIFEPADLGLAGVGGIAVLGRLL